MAKNTSQENQLRILKNLKDTKIKVQVILAAQNFTVGSMMSLALGDVLHLNAGIKDPVYLSISNKKFAKGTVVQSGDKFGLQIDEVLA